MGNTYYRIHGGQQLLVPSSQERPGGTLSLGLMKTFYFLTIAGLLALEAVLGWQAVPSILAARGVAADLLLGLHVGLLVAVLLALRSGSPGGRRD